MTDRPCPICGHTGHSTQEGVAQCRRARETAGFGDSRDLPFLPANRVDGARRTLLGFLDAIAYYTRRVIYGGESGPFVLLYARPSNLPSVKVTIEVHKFEMEEQDVWLRRRGNETD